MVVAVIPIKLKWYEYSSYHVRIYYVATFFFLSSIIGTPLRLDCIRQPRFQRAPRIRHNLPADTTILPVTILLVQKRLESYLFTFTKALNNNW